MDEDKEHNDKQDAAIERGEICTDCGCMIDKPEYDEPGVCADCYDPTP